MSEIVQKQLISQAFRVWAVIASITAIWLFATVAPAILSNIGDGSAGESLFSFFSYICHQIPDRSFHLGEHQFGVCSRCFGVYFGLAIGVLVYPIWRRVENIDTMPRTWLIASIVPMAIDWSLTFFGVWENNHLSRFVTGAILGAACGVYIVPAVVEIVRYAAPPDVPGSAPI